MQSFTREIPAVSYERLREVEIMPDKWFIKSDFSGNPDEGWEPFDPDATSNEDSEENGSETGDDK